MDKYEDSQYKGRFDLKEIIARKNKESPLAQSEKSNDNSKMLAKIRLRKDNKIELCRYDSETRSNPGDSFCEPTQDHTDDIIDKDPRMRDVHFSKFEENDFFEFEKKKKISEQEFEDEQIIKGSKQIEKSILEISSPTKKLKEDEKINDISRNPNTKNKHENDNVTKSNAKSANKYENNININYQVNINQDENNNDLLELHDLLIKNDKQNKKDSDMKNIIQNSPRSKIFDEEVNSRSSGYRQARKQFQDDLNHYESEARSVNESVLKAKMDEDDSVIDAEPKLEEVEFKEYRLKV